MAVVASPPERARLYFRFHPARVPLAADPELTTHRSYRVSKLAVTPEFQQEFESARINPMGELAEPLPISEAGAELTRRYPFDPSESDQEDSQRQFPLPTAQFLIDRGGIVRWANVECAKEGPAGVGAFPTDEELLAVARSVAD